MPIQRCGHSVSAPRGKAGARPIQSCGQSVSAQRGQAGARLNAHTELRAERQRSAREAITESGLVW